MFLGKVALNKRQGTTYVEYTYGRNYIPEKRYNVPKRTTIGKLAQDDQVFQLAQEKSDVIEEEIHLCGYFCIITSRKMTAKEALELYKSRDESEKLFKGDKSYLGNKAIRVQSDEAAEAKIFIEFVALIIRNRIYTSLKEEK